MSYRKRAAQAFNSGVESPLEALGTRALREAQAELQSRDDRDPEALAMLDEALSHEPRDAHERRAAARAYLGVTAPRTKNAIRVETKRNEDEGLVQDIADLMDYSTDTDVPRNVQECIEAMDPADPVGAADLAGEILNMKCPPNMRRTLERIAKNDIEGPEIDDTERSAGAVEAKGTIGRGNRLELGEWLSQAAQDAAEFASADAEFDAGEFGGGEDAMEEARAYDDASRLILEDGDLEGALELLENTSTNSKTMKEARERVLSMIDQENDKSLSAVDTKAFADRDELALALREWSDEASDAEDEDLATGLADAARLVENGDLREAIDAILDSVPDGPDSEKAVGMIQDFIDESKSARAVETKGAMPIVAFDAANEEGLDDLEADVNDLAYKHNASGMDADTSGGHCEVYFEVAIDAANFVEALQAGDLIGYTVSNLELVPTDGEDAGEDKAVSRGARTKGAGETKTGSRSPQGVIEILERLYTLLEQSDDKLAMRETDDLITALTETSLNRETKPELAASIRELWDAFEDGSEEASLCSEAAEALGAINVDDYNGI